MAEKKTKLKEGEYVRLAAEVTKVEGDTITFKICDSKGEREHLVTLNGSQLEAASRA